MKSEPKQPVRLPLGLGPVIRRPVSCKRMTAYLDDKSSLLKCFLTSIIEKMRK